MAIIGAIQNGVPDEQPKMEEEEEAGEEDELDLEQEPPVPNHSTAVVAQFGAPPAVNDVQKDVCCALCNFVIVFLPFLSSRALRMRTTMLGRLIAPSQIPIPILNLPMHKQAPVCLLAPPWPSLRIRCLSHINSHKPVHTLLIRTNRILIILSSSNRRLDNHPTTRNNKRSNISNLPPTAAHLSKMLSRGLSITAIIPPRSQF
jgi:hypothetical protein